MELLKAFGAPKDSCIDLYDTTDARCLRYTDLVRNRKAPVVDCVVEQQSHALLYVKDQTRLRDDQLSIADLQRILAMRGEPAWLGILKPGRLDIYATDLQPAQNTTPTWFSVADEQAPSVLPRLAQGENLAKPASLRLRDELLRLMSNSGEALRELGLSNNETIALIGRALFFRFLIGRKIVGVEHLPSIAPSAASLSACFDTSSSLAETNSWLDETFNGDLLALPTKGYADYFRHLLERCGQSVTQPLSSIMTLDSSLGPGVSQRRLDWGDLDFDHLPIGLLSETYEELMYRFNASARRSTSIYYTPYHIAEYMVEEAFHEHPAGSKARLLDPACGAGVFLVAGFRKLIELRFREVGKRPSRQQIRSILNKQLVGFDTNDHARTLAALALYLTALELDPHPAPVEALRFKKLEDNVLINVADPGSPTDEITLMVGSLGEHVPKEYENAFDVVIGNPPWTSLTKAEASIDNKFTQRCREIAFRRGLVDVARNYRNPDRVPDLPFVWGAMEWAKPGGRIALAVAGRWMFKQTPVGIAARNALFRALAITGILNGAALRQTRVWPNVAQPFCLLFADNHLPDLDDEFVFLSPFYEPHLNEKGLLRVDASDAKPVSFRLCLNNPIALKTLYRGTTLDIPIVAKVKKAAETTIGGYWAQNAQLEKGQGYQLADRSGDDRFLLGKPELEAGYAVHPFVVLSEKLDKYQSKGLQWPRKPEIYKGPLLLVREASRDDRNRGRALMSLGDRDIAYSRSFYGYSAAAHPDGEFLVRYLSVLIHSKLFEYVTLMTSGRYGVEREVLQLLDIDQFPLIAPESLSSKERRSIQQCADDLIRNRPDWNKLDVTVADIYGLSEGDLKTVADTLDINSPHASARGRSMDVAPEFQIEDFLSHLKSELASVFSAGGHAVRVQKLGENPASAPWRFFSVTLDNAKPALELPKNWIDHAYDLGTSRITVLSPNSSCLTVGLLNRYRYWMPSLARLLAADILWEFGAHLEDKAS
jgi:hypothetical protein